MSNEELRRLLVGAVPQTPVPVDRWSLVSQRVQRRRRRRLVATVAAAVLAVAVVGTGAVRLAPAGHHVLPPADSPLPDYGPVPVGDPGSSAVRVVRTGELPTPSADGDGIFRTVCLYSRMGTADPIHASTYLTMFWGDTGTGRSTCRGGVVDRSAYWAPAVVDTRTGTPLAPDLVHVYFESGYLGVHPADVQPMPQGLRMLTTHLGWQCFSSTGPPGRTVPSCRPGDAVALVATFPQCWDGRHVDSPDHMSHLAYAVARHGCPSGYPVALPQISYHVLFPVTATTDTTGWRLAAQADASAGWVNGWREDILDTWIPGCVRVAKTCGSHMLGDGRVLQGDR